MLMGIVVAAALAGCFLGAATSQRPPADMTDEALVGSWQTESGAVFVFRADHTFSVSDLPPAKFEKYGNLPSGFDPKHDQLPASGTWEILRPPGATAGPYSRVGLHLRSLAQRPVTIGTELLAQKEDQETVLTLYLGDPDSDVRVVYYKCASTCVPAPGSSAGRTPTAGVTRLASPT